MALSFAQGVIQWLSSSAATTTYTVSGLSFQPKALRFYWSGIASATTATSTTVDMQMGVGVATSTSDRRCVGTYDDDAAATMDCGAGYRDDAIAVTLDGTTTPVGMLDLTAINSDGFVLTVDDQTPQALTIFWEAWGGTDITNATTGEIAEPAATGNVDYTITGSFQPDVLMFAGCQATGAAPTAEAKSSGFCLGYATSGSDDNNIVLAGNNEDGSAAADADGYGLSSECLAMITAAGGNPDARAKMTQFNSDGFRLNWIARAVTDRKYIYLAVKGGRWTATDIIFVGTALGTTHTVSGLAYTPKGISLFGGRKIESTAGTSALQHLICMGSGTSTTSRVGTGMLQLDGSASSNVNVGVRYDAIFSDYNAAGRALDIDSMNSDGFRLIREVVAETTANVWYGYLTFGNSLAARIPRPIGVGHPFIC